MQNIFDYTFKKLIEQGKPSYIKNGSHGFYRLKEEDDTLKCPIGYLLSDEQIKKYEINDYDTVFSFPADLIAELNTAQHNEYEFTTFLHQLQVAHDDIGSYIDSKLTKPEQFVSELKYKYNNIAKQFNLKEIDG